MKINRMLLISIICLIVFCAITVVFRVVPLGELPLSFVGAALGAVITGVVTTILLEGQTRAQEIKERNVAVFNEKSQIYKKFIKEIWEAWSNHIIESTEYEKLTSIFYQELMLYSNVDTQNIIGKALIEIGDCLDIDANENSEVENKLRKNIVIIIDTLIKELSLGGRIDPKLFGQLDGQMEKARERIRSERKTFKTLGIKKGTELVYKKDPSITCITHDDNNKVLFHDEVRTISNVAVELNDGKSANGFAFFTLNGTTLVDIQEKIQK